MADPRILSRRNSYSHSETSDAGSSSTSARETSPDTGVPPVPVVRSEPVVQRPPVVPAANSLPLTAGGASAPALAAPQQASALTASNAQRSWWEWDAKASTLTLNEIFTKEDQIPKLLAAYPSVEHIVVQPNLVTDSALGVIRLLGAATNVTSIHFSRPINSSGGYNDCPYLDNHSARALADLARTNPALTKLTFQNLPFIPECEFFSSLADGLKDNVTVTVLEISNSVYRLQNMPKFLIGNSIAELLTKNKGIKTVIAPHNEMWVNGNEAIGAALARNESLITLDLGYNEIKSNGAKAIIDGLRKNKKSVLSKLDLSGCQMDAQSAKSLGKLLKQNTSLKEIIVGNVKDAEGKQYIANGLQANKSACKVQFVG